MCVKKVCAFVGLQLQISHLNPRNKWQNLSREFAFSVRLQDTPNI
jgi:hypothetical protein